ncbi:EAL domain-containing protein [Pedomonas sp. V897]|uniref:EAL domain-containing protein n=1 Tax=Pedomonas sp. V897 TaxID=3446482 RepID=UPI003EE19FB6
MAPPPTDQRNTDTPTNGSTGTSASAPPDTGTPDTRTLRILIVDDDPDICAELASMLELRGHQVRWITNPHQLEDLETFDPQILILDLGLPSRDGFEIISTLPLHFPGAQLIVSSGHDTRIIRAAARRAETRGVRVLGTLRKPYPPGALLRLLLAYAPSRPAPPAVQAPQTRPADRIADLLTPDTLDTSLAVAFQEKRDLSTEEIHGYEALLRSRLPGYSNPELFFRHDVPLDLQIAITTLVIERALASAARLLGADSTAGGLISVNCTPDILCHPQFMSQVEILLTARPDVIDILAIEITEHNTLESADDIMAAAGRLSVRGFQIALDDFGIGINNFDSLLNLHCEEVKMDKKIFWQFFANRDSDSIAREVIRYCHERGVLVTIEGIETREHLSYALDLGADFGQGFLWGRPEVPPSASLLS